MARVFNPPPGWPKPEEGWTPPPGWRPDPSWPEPPQGWDFWIEKADDVGSSLFENSILSAGSSLFEKSESTTDSYGSVSPSGKAVIPGAPEGPDFTASQEPESPSREPRSPSQGPPPSSPTLGQSSRGPSSDPYGVRAGPTGAGQQREGVRTGTTGTSSAGRDPNTGPSQGPGGGGTVLLGLVLIAVGVGATIYSVVNAATGEEYTIWWAAIVIGVIMVIMGAVRMARVRASRRRMLGSTGAGYDPGGVVTQPGGPSGGLRTGQSSTVPMRNPTDPKSYRRP